ncbi:MAG: adenosylhomocysteinase [Candidatus Woesearchaeota archaeon]|nr:adenosylhomocysteinase [Candidatus Woesearchaeota archaeon]
MPGNLSNAPQYAVKDISLAEQGKKNIEWAEAHMNALLELQKRLMREKPFKGIRIGMALHVTKETAVLVKTFISGGADVAICSCNPLSTQDDAAAALASMGIKVYAWKGESREEYYSNLSRVIDFKPNITIDDGCDLVNEIHTKHPELISSIIGGCEETTTGVIRLRAMKKDNALKYPVVAVNDNKTKHLMDNYYGTGQSAIDGIIRATNILFAGKNVVVCGYGDCGKGVSLKAKGFGANVIVTEVTAFRALQAVFDGFRVMPIADAARIGDIFVTVTGDKKVISTRNIEIMKNNAILANAGHFDAEIDVAGLKKMAKATRKIRPFLDEFTLRNGKKVYLCADGRLVNLGAAEGHPSEVMSMSFCGQALAVEFLVKNRGKTGIEVIDLPESIDEQISRLQLATMGIKIDTLTDEQIKYLAGWKEGT